MPPLDWNDLRFVLAVHRAGSLAGAAVALGVDESTVTRRLRRAEKRLAARLFERHRSGVTLTAAGGTVVAAAEQMERAAQSAEQSVAGADSLVAGTVRLTAVPVVACHLLLPALPALLAAEPRLEVELVAEPRDLSLTRRESDLALRMARPTREMAVLARRVGRLDYGVFAPAGADADGLPWLVYDDAMADLPQTRWMSERAKRQGERVARVRVNDALAVLAGVRAGLGRSLLPLRIAGPDPALQRLDAGPPALSRELWLMVHPDLRDLARVRRVVDWVTDTIGEHTRTAASATAAPARKAPAGKRLAR